MPFKEPTLPETGIRVGSQTPETPALSPLQASLLLRALSQGTRSAPVKHVVVRLSTEDDLDALARSCLAASERFPQLARRFRWAADGPCSEPLPAHAGTPPVRRARLPLHENDDPGQREVAWLDDEALQGLDPFEGPCCRWTILEGAHPPRLVFTAHEVLLDDPSALAVVRDVFLVTGFPAGVPPRPRLQDEPAPATPRSCGPAEPESARWARYLEEAPTPTPAPGATISKHRSRKGTVVASHRLDPGLAGPLRSLANRQGVPLRRLLEASWALLLQRCTGAGDLLFATARSRPPSDPRSPGQFLEVTPFRARVDLASPFLEWVHRIHQARRDLEDGPAPALEQALAWGEATAGAARVEMVFLTAPVAGRLGVGDRTFEFHRQDGFPLTIVADDSEDLLLHLIGAGDRYSAEPLRRLLDHWGQLLAAIALAPTVPVASIPWMTPGQQRNAVRAGQGAVLPLPTTARVHDRILDWARLSPSAPAVAVPGAELSYHHLVQSASALAVRLRHLGVGPGDAVPLCSDRSFEMMVGVLGILMAGAAYAPLDPAYPTDRLRLMIEDLAPRAILTQERYRPLLAGTAATIVVLEVPDDLTRDADATGGAPASLPTGVAPSDPTLAYVIFTSGSTGRPKGVAMGHRPLSNLLAWHEQHLPARPEDRTLQFASLSFDVSFQEIFTTWHGGGTVELITEEQRRDPGALWKILAARNVTRVFLPFIALQQLAEAAAADPTTTPVHLREVITAGEQLQITPAIRSMFHRLPGARLHNHYGPSETHVVTALTLARDPDSWPELPSIGRPIPNTLALVLDATGSPQPDEVPGEIVLGGACLAEGYFRRADLTAERFVEITVPGLEGGPQRFYRTGDLGRRLPEGAIEFLGRADGQVKIRGHRVELGEIECALGQVNGVRSCAVIAQTFRGEQRLVAYFVPSPSGHPSLAEVRAALQERLPQALVPSVLVPLGALPLTPSGKINRRALPDPASLQPPPVTRPPGPGLTPTESLLAEIWHEVLGVDGLGPTDHFFHLGGTSLLVLQVHRLLRAQGRHGLSVADLFQHPTLAGLARHLDAVSSPASSNPLAASAASRAARQRQALAGTRRPGIAHLPKA